MRFTAAILLIALCLPLQARSSAYDRYADTSRCLQLKSIASEFTTWKEEAKEKESDRTNLLKLADLLEKAYDLDVVLDKALITEPRGFIKQFDAGKITGDFALKMMKTGLVRQEEQLENAFFRENILNGTCTILDTKIVPRSSGQRVLN